MCPQSKEQIMSGQEPIGPEFSHDIPRLLQFFEGLGENCDFGVVQRAVGIEPFGLFRFAACKAADVAALLRARFEPLGEPEDLWLDEVGPRREYWVKSRQFSFEAHTDRFGGVDDPEVARTAQIERIRFLKSRLIRDLSGARRIFVFKGKSDVATIREIVVQLRTFGQNDLLWVNVADAAHRPGSVERVSNGLMFGFVSCFGTYDGDPSLPVEEWIAVCANAYRLWRHTEPPQAPFENLIAQAMGAGSCRWFADPAVTTRALDEQGPAGGVVLEHRLGKTETISVYRAHLPITSGGNFVLSAWVLIPEGFRGRQIATLLPGFSSVAMWTADLKSRARWQRIWVTANLPTDARGISCEIIAEGALGDIFRSASWCLERGSQPLGYGFAL
jgi:hypothetical protein